MYIITARRITSGELLKQRKGLCIDGGYRTPLPGSSRIALTLPGKGYVEAADCLCAASQSLATLADAILVIAAQAHCEPDISAEDPR